GRRTGGVGRGVSRTRGATGSSAACGGLSWAGFCPPSGCARGGEHGAGDLRTSLRAPDAAVLRRSAPLRAVPHGHRAQRGARAVALARGGGGVGAPGRGLLGEL